MSSASATTVIRHLLAGAVALLPLVSSAHAFVQPYTLPVPFSLYATGAAAALVLSFIIVGVFAGAPSRGYAPHALGTARPLNSSRGWFVGLGRTLSVGLLTLAVVSGLVGTQRPLLNFNMTFFWIIFVLGMPYAVSLFGDFYSDVNPWRVLVAGIERLGVSFEGRARGPQRWGYTPALLMYMSFIWIELFGGLHPRGLSLVLLAYTAVNIVGAWWMGRVAWFQYGEFFGVALRVLALMSPVARASEFRDMQTAAAQSNWRPPFLGLISKHVQHRSLMLFILFMLSSTAFDGLHATVAFSSLFWEGVYPALAPWVPYAPGQQYAMATTLYYAWQWGVLLVSPVLYWAVFCLFVWVAKVLTGSGVSVESLVLRFSFSLVPIAFVYHVTHYYTLLLAQGGQIVRLLSDPFGWGWNLFGTAGLSIDPIVIDVESIWHTQVGLILIGHIVSVYLAHMEALRVFPTQRTAALSQLPLLVLMVIFTTTGLWILSLPLTAGA